MNRENLLAELHRLLDAGEPLLTMFPRKHPDVWLLQLPANISPEMRLYARHVALRAWGRAQYKDFRQRDAIAFLAELVKRGEVGLLGWRAIGVLK